MKPLNDYVLIKPDDPIRKTAGGIIVPETVKDPPKTGVVLAISDELQEKAADIINKPVIFKQMSDIKLEDGTLLVKYENLLVYAE